MSLWGQLHSNYHILGFVNTATILVYVSFMTVFELWWQSCVVKTKLKLFCQSLDMEWEVTSKQEPTVQESNLDHLR